MCSLDCGRTSCATITQETRYLTADGIDAEDLRTFSMSGNLQCGLDAAGHIRCGGFDQYDLLDVPDGVWMAVAAGNSHACALALDGTPTCWGADFDGAIEVPSGTHLRSVVTGDNRTCGQLLASDGWICWGRRDVEPLPTAADEPVTMAMNGVTLYGVRADGTLGAWGLDDGDSMPHGDGYVRVDPGTSAVCALHESGRVDCWGPGVDELGAAPDGRWTDLAVGEGFVCAREAAGDVRCWGCGGTCPVTAPTGL